MTRIEMSLYQPAEQGKESLFVLLTELGDNEILLNQTIDLGIKTGIPDDTRPLYVAFRQKGGPVTHLNYAIFSFTLSRMVGELTGMGGLEERPMTTDVVKLEFDPSEVIGSDTVWHPFILTIDDAVEVSRVQVRWGALVNPFSGLPSAPAYGEEGEVTLFAQADPATIP